MSEPTKPETNPDDLTKTAEPGTTELTDRELNQVSGGVGGIVITKTTDKPSPGL